MKLTKELLADGYRRGLNPPQIAAEAGCTRSHVMERTDRFGLRPEYELMMADRADARLALKAAQKERERRNSLRRERERWLETCDRVRAKWEPVVSANYSGGSAMSRIARNAWVASQDECRSDGTTNQELMVWLREFIVDVGVSHKFAQSKWTEWAKARPDVRLKTSSQVRVRIAFDPRLQDLFDGGME